MVISHADPEEGTPPEDHEYSSTVHGDTYAIRVCSNIHLSAEVEEQLEILTRVAGILGIDDLSFSSYSAALMRLSDEILSLKRASLQLKRAETELQAHRDSYRHEEKLINKWQTSIEQEHERGSTAEMARKKEALVKKAKEYKKELDALMIQVEEPPVTITQLAAQQARIKKREADIKAKRAKIRAFQGLPPNLYSARMQLKGARDEQMELIKLRERILGKMADGIS